jgi:hypothetical protein
MALKQTVERQAHELAELRQKLNDGTQTSERIQEDLKAVQRQARQRCEESEKLRLANIRLQEEHHRLYVEGENAKANCEAAVRSLERSSVRVYPKGDRNCRRSFRVTRNSCCARIRA